MTACSLTDLVGPKPEAEAQPEVTPEPVEERQYNYITGEKLKFEELATMRPVAVMVDNSKYAMPQSGIEAAEIIYEMVTEGGITRLMAVFSDIDEVEDVGPIRSARDQFVQFALPLNAIYVHIGTSIYASEMLNFYHYQNVDGLYLGSSSFVFDAKRAEKYAHEHCWYTDDGMIEEGMRRTGISINGNLYPAFNFADYREEAVTLDDGLGAEEIRFRFSDYAKAAFHYNEKENRYYKDAFGQPQIDASTGNQIAFENVILLETTITLYPDGLCTAFDFEAGGMGYYFYGGRYIPVTWQKGQPEEPLQLFDAEGNPVEINVGKTYVGIIDKSMLKTLKIEGGEEESTEAAAPAEENKEEKADDKSKDDKKSDESKDSEKDEHSKDDTSKDEDKSKDDDKSKEDSKEESKEDEKSDNSTAEPQ